MHTLLCAPLWCSMLTCARCRPAGSGQGTLQPSGPRFRPGSEPTPRNRALKLGEKARKGNFLLPSLGESSDPRLGKKPGQHTNPGPGLRTRHRKPVDTAKTAGIHGYNYASECRMDGKSSSTVYQATYQPLYTQVHIPRSAWGPGVCVRTIGHGKTIATSDPKTERARTGPKHRCPRGRDPPTVS